MKKGFVIAKNGLAKEFFTSSSAYDRPVWLPMNEATVYPTIDTANAAMQKLIRKGQYQVLVTEMNLSISPIEPTGDRPMGMSGDEEMPPEDGEDLEGLDDEAGEGDLDSDEADPEGDDEDAMVASDTEEVCPKCGHEPCTCEDHDDEDMSDFDLGDEIEGEGGEDDDISDDELDDLLGDKGPGEDDELEQEADPAFDGRRLGMAQMSPMGAPRMESATLPTRPKGDPAPSENKATAATTNTRVPVISYKDKSGDTTDTTQFQNQNDEKVRVPSNVISSLNAVAADFDKQAEFSKTSDEARASFCMTVADAARDIVALLSQGTVEGVKMANLKLSSYMNPITSHFPPEAIKFIYSGGQKPSLKDWFNAKREEKR